MICRFSLSFNWRASDDFANFIVIIHYVFILEMSESQEGNLFVIYDNES